MQSFKSSRPQRPDLFQPVSPQSPSSETFRPPRRSLKFSPLSRSKRVGDALLTRLNNRDLGENSSKNGDSPKNTAPEIETVSLGLRAWALRFWLVLAVVWLTIYLGYRISYVNLNPWLAPLSILVCFAEMHILLHLYGMFYSLWPRRYQTWTKPNYDRNLRANLFVCVCGEPPEVVRETIKSALQAASLWNHKVSPHHPARVVVLNDGKVARKDNWQDIERICEEMDVLHIARDVPGGFKAGNINNGLRQTPTDDPHNTLDIVFDSDFCAKPEFLLEITKPFVQNDVDFVQSPQRYKNETNWVAKAAAAHQIFFFDWICPAKGHDNALFLCGTNFAIRRSALDKVGGLEERFITEDYATSLELHFAGCKGVFMPQVLALGMAPTSLKQYFTQQKRWSKGNFDVTGAYFKKLFFGPLTWKQKMHYMLSATYYLIGLRDLILMLAPLPYLYFNQSLIKPNSLWFLMWIYAPMLVANFIMYLKMFRFPIKSLVLDLVSFPIFTAAFFGALFKEQLGFVVTIKKYEKERPLDVYRPQIIICVLLTVGLVYSVIAGNFNGFGSLINYWWAGFNAIFLALGFYLLIQENARWKGWEANENAEENKQSHKVVNIAGLLLPQRTALASGVVVMAMALPAAAWLYDARRPLEPYKPLKQMAAPKFSRGQIYEQVALAPTQKVVALTFDDGPDPKWTPQVLEILAREKIRASFYLIGQGVQSHPRLARQINAEGHDIGNHSWSHHPKPQNPTAEIVQTNRVIEKTVGVVPTHFRPPMGIMENGMVDQAMRHNQAVVLWSADPKDWSNPTPEAIAERVLRDAKPGGIILLHDGGGDRTPTIKALPAIITGLRERGYRFVTVPQLLAMKKNAPRVATRQSDG